jgi:acyl dehydratase
MDASLIPDETRALLGELMDEPVTAVITARDAQRYAYAVDDLNPIYFDEAAAKAAGYRTLVAPPTFVGHVVAPTRALADVRVDGIYRGGGRSLHLRGVDRVMAGGEDWDYLEPAYVGDVITAESRLYAIDQREGRTGAFVTSVVETSYTNQDGVLVARCRRTGIAR